MAIVTAALLVGGLSWVGGSLVASSRSGKATLKVPRASLITAVVERGTIVATIHGRAQVGYADIADVDAPPGGGRVTKVDVSLGDEAGEGTVLAEVDGRPIVILRGPVPMYRPLVLGISGPDVLQFEQALQRLGIDPGPVDGTFDASTELSVGQFYRSVGSAPVAPTPEQRASYSAAKEAVTQARLKVLADQHAVDLDRVLLDPGERAALDKVVVDADLAVQKAVRDRDALGPALDAKVRVARTALARSQDAVDAIRTQLAAAGDPTIRSTVNAQLVAAQGALDEAQAAVDELDRSRPGEIADADAAVVSALTAASAARSARSDKLVSKNRDLLAQTLVVSTEALAEAEQRLADEAAVVGAGIPLGEVAFLADLPRRVQTIAKVGDVPTSALATLSTGEPVGRWFVRPSEREQLAVGAAVTLSDNVAGTRITGVVSVIASAPGDASQVAAGTRSTDPSGTQTTAASPVPAQSSASNADKFLVTITLRPDPATPVAALIGADLQVGAPTSTSGEGLLVPLAAVTSGDDGGARVRRAMPSGESEIVPVTIGVSGDGQAVVVPVDSGALHEGDRVVVGR